MKDELNSIPAAVREKLRYYVYLYIDPQSNRVFYVGKGKDNRALAHLDGASNPAVAQAIRRIHKAGFEVRIDILKYGLDQEGALETEAAAIEAYGLATLENSVSGHIGESGRRCRLSDLVHYFEQKVIIVEEPCILIKINQTYKPGMSPLELYEATRGIWRISPEEAKRVRYALAVYDRAVLEAYELARDEDGHSRWFPAGTTAYFTRFQEQGRWPKKRIEFVGRPVEGKLRRRLIGKLQRGMFPEGSRNPIQYWPPE